MTIYFIGSYLRLYPQAWMSRNWICVPILLMCVVLSYIEVFVGDYAIAKGWTTSNFSDWFVSESSKFLALLVGVFLFLVFRNLNLGYSKVINIVASTTFGVLLIHANSDAMRKFLWHDLLHVADHYSLPLGSLVLFSILSVSGVYLVCSLVDYVRIKLFDHFLFSRL